MYHNIYIYIHNYILYIYIHIIYILICSIIYSEQPQVIQQIRWTWPIEIVDFPPNFLVVFPSRGASAMASTAPEPVCRLRSSFGKDRILRRLSTGRVWEMEIFKVPSGYVKIAIVAMAIEIVDLPINKMVIFYSHVSL